MKFWKAFLPNLSIALNAALLVVLYLDRRNPMMGFLVGRPFEVLVISACVCSILSAAILYGSWRKKGRKRRNQENTEPIK